jgi:hypothetical protein
MANIDTNLQQRLLVCCLKLQTALRTQLCEHGRHGAATRVTFL